MKKGRKCRKSNQQGGSYVEILRQGEKAAREGKTVNPYQGEDAEIWQEGFDEEMNENAKI